MRWQSEGHLVLELADGVVFFVELLQRHLDELLGLVGLVQQLLLLPQRQRQLGAQFQRLLLQEALSALAVATFQHRTGRFLFGVVNAVLAEIVKSHAIPCQYPTRIRLVLALGI